MTRAGEPAIRLVNRALRYFQLNDVPDEIAFSALQDLSARLALLLGEGGLDQAQIDTLWDSVRDTALLHGRAPGAQVRPRSLQDLPVRRGSIGYAEL
ncbi:hypothetical protein Q4485_17285 [Granulosicoccaceae sp. 1_MG-2023]|nr:hypothetical protein [Granulosicoccaceae sp. 1_MG-2023]